MAPEAALPAAGDSQEAPTMPDAADLGGLVPLPSETKDEHRGGSRGDSVRTDVNRTLAGEQDG